MPDGQDPVTQDNAKLSPNGVKKSANRRDLLRTATGVVAATVVGGVLLESNAGTAGAASGAPPNPPSRAQITVSVDITRQEGFSFDALGFHFEIANPIDPATGKQSGNVTYPPATVIKDIDVATPKLLDTLQMSTPIQAVVIKYDAGRGSVESKIEWDLFGVSVVKIDQRYLSNVPGQQESDPIPTESISLNYTKIRISDF